MTEYYAEKQAATPFESPRDTAPSVAEMLALTLVREFERPAEMSDWTIRPPAPQSRK
jgi:hypothetical protein